MNVKLSDNLRSFRKKRNLTQEQLAEAINVSVGVISKWELGMSAPDLGILMELADFFETSVDVLLGYQIQSISKLKSVEWLKRYIHNKHLPVPFDEVEKLLLRYPNDFEIVFRSANLYEVRGMEAQNTKHLYRALSLYEWACTLIEQNTNEEISVTSIQGCIADIYRYLDNKEKAIEILRANNPCGVNNARLGSILAIAEKQEDAIRYLSNAMIQQVNDMFSIALGYTYVYLQTKRYHETIAVIDWLETVITASRLPGKTSYEDKILSGFITTRSYAYYLLKNFPSAKASLKQAKEMAQRFDSDPCYAANQIRFAEIDVATAYDGYGTTAMEGVELTVSDQNDSGFAVLWAEVKKLN